MSLPPYAVDENLRMFVRAARESIRNFYNYAMRLYDTRYLDKPTYSHA